MARAVMCSGCPRWYEGEAPVCGLGYRTRMGVRSTGQGVVGSEECGLYRVMTETGYFRPRVEEVEWE